MWNSCPSSLSLTTALLLPAAALCQTFSPLSYVDPLIGSQAGGNVFSGATLPYGLAKAVADVDGQNTGGFGLDGSNVTGFSSVHDSGTGGNPSLGNFPLFPQLCRDDDLDGCMYRIDDRKVHYVNGSVKAEIGYFSIDLMSGIRAEMTVSERAALYRFTFPEGSGEHPHIMLDLTDLWKSRQNASIHVDDKTGRMAGNGTFLPSFGAGSYVLHFCVDFFGADIHDTGVWVNNRAGTEPKQLYVTRGFNLFYIEAGGFVRFKTKKDRTVTVRMGISFKSNEQACQSAETEIPSPDTDFSRLVTEAKTAWQAKLSQIEVKSGGASEDLLKSFWSGAYRNMISPQNYTGENPHWDTGKPYFDSFYCMWDSFRVQHPFLTVVDPDAQAQMVQALLDIYKHDGWLPDCHMSMCSGWTQGGSNADVVIADAYHKNLSDSIDWELALQAVMTDAEDEPLEWSIHGRGGLQSWKKLDYIPYLDYDPLGFGTNSRSISRTLEYAYDDYCISTMADGMGKRDAAAKYLKRSTNWMNLWKEDQTSLINGTDTGFRGSSSPNTRMARGDSRIPLRVLRSLAFALLLQTRVRPLKPAYGNISCNYVPHSTAALITLLGGDEAFIKRLDYFHTIGLADISNEPVFLTVYLYHYAGRPALSASRIHTYIPKSFNSAPGGLPGNDDSGAMGSFLFFSVIGLFPVAGQNVYLISPSFFEQVSIKSPQTGKTATVRNENFDAGYKNIYIQSAKVNGKAWTKSWIGHEFFTEGWTLELVLGGKESDWGTRLQDRPPSFAAKM